MDRTINKVNILWILAGLLLAFLLIWGLLSPQGHVASAAVEDCSQAATFLSGLVTDNGASSGTAKAAVTNNSQSCTYTVGLAAYQLYTLSYVPGNLANTPGLFGKATAVLVPGQTATVADLHVAVPDCRYELDLFQGDVLVPPNFAAAGSGHFRISTQNVGEQVCLNYIAGRSGSGGSGSGGSGSGSGGSGSGGSGSGGSGSGSGTTTGGGGSTGTGSGITPTPTPTPAPIGSGTGGGGAGGGVPNGGGNGSVLGNNTGNGSNNGANGSNGSNSAAQPGSVGQPSPGTIMDDGMGGAEPPQVLAANTGLPRTGIAPLPLLLLLLFLIGINIYLALKYRKIEKLQ